MGSTLYELLTGRPPYAGANGGIAALLLRVLSGDPPPIGRSDVDARVQEVVFHAMARDPAERYPDAAALVHALQRVQLALGFPLTEAASAPSLPSDQMPAPVAPTPVRPADPPSEPTGTPPAVLPDLTALLAEPSPADAAPRPGNDKPANAWHAKESGLSRAEAAAVIGLGSQTREVPPDERDTESPVRTRSSPVTKPLAPPRKRRHWPVVVIVLAAGLVAVLAPLAFAGRRNAHPTADASAPATSPSRFLSPQAISPAQLAAAQPSAVTVTDQGTSAGLHWTLAPGTTRASVVIWQGSSRGEAKFDYGADPGGTSYTVTGLDPAAGYCFKVGVIVGFADGKAQVAYSDPPTCIRGAVASPAA